MLCLNKTGRGEDFVNLKAEIRAWLVGMCILAATLVVALIGLRIIFAEPPVLTYEQLKEKFYAEQELVEDVREVFFTHPQVREAYWETYRDTDMFRGRLEGLKELFDAKGYEKLQRLYKRFEPHVIEYYFDEQQAGSRFELYYHCQGDEKFANGCWFLWLDSRRAQHPSQLRSDSFERVWEDLGGGWFAGRRYEKK